MNSSRLAGFFSGALLFVTLGACAAESFGPSIYTGQVARFDIAEDKAFADPEQDMRYLLVQAKRNDSANHFCVVGYQWPDGKRKAAVHWQEGQRIVLWTGKSGVSDAFKYADSMAMANSVDLKDGLVDTDEQRFGSSFLQLRSSAEGTLADCKAHGRQYLIEPFTPPSESDEDE